MANEVETKVENKLKTYQDFGLNINQAKFSELYTSADEFFGNGAWSYIEAYDVDKAKPNYYKTAMASASRLLRNVKVCEYINHLLELRGLNNEFVDKQLEFLVTQHADFKSKLGAIHEYNQLKRRVDSGGNKTLVLMITGESANRYGATPGVQKQNEETKGL